jgi:UPF0755 protein
LLAVSLGVIFIYHLYFSPPVYREDSPETGVFIPEGLSTMEIARSLKDDGIIDNPIVFVLLARLLGLDRKLKAGKYNLQRDMAELDCVKIVSEGGIKSLRVTIPEGLTVDATARLLEKELEIDGQRLLSLCADSAVMQRFDLEGESLEGYLFPDTYRFGWGMKEEEILEVMVRRFRTVFAEEWMNVGGLSELSRYEVLILASIIEGETLRHDESPLISAVFHNRLRLNRPLQADPTIQYILREHKPRILYKHLKIDSPYNTYLYRGLPPSPICSPGRMSMRAAMSPAPVDYLYFVAEGNGRHIFSRTLKEHNLAKRAVRSKQ